MYFLLSTIITEYKFSGCAKNALLSSTGFTTERGRHINTTMFDFVEKHVYDRQ